MVQPSNINIRGINKPNIRGSVKKFFTGAGWWNMKKGGVPNVKINGREVNFTELKSMLNQLQSKQGLASMGRDLVDIAKNCLLRTNPTLSNSDINKIVDAMAQESFAKVHGNKADMMIEVKI